MLIGCSSTSPARSSRSLSAGDFASPTAAAGPQTPAPSDAAPARPAAPPRVTAAPIDREGQPATLTGPVGASEGLADVESSVGAPALEATEPRPLAEPIFVDAKIGDVNNRAIYASAFLDRIIDQLRADYLELRKANPRTALAQWRPRAAAEIRRELESIIEDEVLRAEALSSLQPEQKAGFFNWLNTVRSEIVAENRGSATAANENLSAATGESLDRYMKKREQQALIRFILDTRINTRANVAWRDIQFAYEKNNAIYNPPPVAHFRTISVPSDRKEEIQRITDVLASGADFELVAAERNPRGNPDANLVSLQFEGDYATHEFYRIRELNEALQKLSPGQVGGPVNTGRITYWFKLVKIERLSQSLYDAQIALEHSLTDSRQRFERKKFVERLKQRASFTDVDVMTQRLLVLAEERVLTTASTAPASAPAPASPASANRP